MSKNAMILTAVIAIVIFAYFYWKQKQIPTAIVNPSLT